MDDLRFSLFPFQLHAQPIVAADATLVAVELLVRPPDGSSAAPVLGRALRWSARLALDREVTRAAARFAAQGRSWSWAANLSPPAVADAIRYDRAPPPQVWWEISEQVPKGWVVRCRRGGGRLAADDVAAPRVAGAWVARGVDIIKIDRCAATDPARLGALLQACGSATVVVEGVSPAQVPGLGAVVLVQSFAVAAPVPVAQLIAAAAAGPTLWGPERPSTLCEELP